MSFSFFDSKRFYVKIVMGSQQALAETMYYRNNVPFEVFRRWNWYFLYREALYRIKMPKAYIRLETGSYDHVPSQDRMISALEQQIIRHKGICTQYNNKLAILCKNWSEIFPVEDDPKYKPTIERIKMEESKLVLMTSDLNRLLTGEKIWIRTEQDTEDGKTFEEIWIDNRT